jgi:hypothetical protein
MIVNGIIYEPLYSVVISIGVRYVGYRSISDFLIRTSKGREHESVVRDGGGECDLSTGCPGKALGKVPARVDVTLPVQYDK